MFTKENPCKGVDLDRFISWWSDFTGKSLQAFSAELDTLRVSVEADEQKVKAARQKRSKLSEEDRVELGFIQEDLIPKKRQLLERECARPDLQPEMILLVPRVAGFSFEANNLIFVTECLYGRDHRSSAAPWCRIGRMEITLTAYITDTGRDRRVSVFWKNLDGNHSVGIISGNGGRLSVAAPQIQGDGKRSCMGNPATNVIAEGHAKGRLDIMIAMVLRFTEYPLISQQSGFGMGDFPSVSDDEVPEFYLKTFPR